MGFSFRHMSKLSDIDATVFLTLSELRHPAQKKLYFPKFRELREQTFFSHLNSSKLPKAQKLMSLVATEKQ